MILKQETDGYLFLRFARAASFPNKFCNFTGGVPVGMEMGHR